MARTAFLKVLTGVLSFNLIFLPVLQAEEAIRPASPREQASRPEIVDVMLVGEGGLNGQVLSEAGEAIDGAEVGLWKGETLLQTATTDAAGGFQFHGVRTGLYRVDAPGQSTVCRAWGKNVTPPGATDGLVLVSRSGAVRGQFGWLDPVSTTAILLGVAGVTLSAITLSEVNNLQDDVDDLNDRIDALNSP